MEDVMARKAIKRSKGASRWLAFAICLGIVVLVDGALHIVLRVASVESMSNSEIGDSIYTDGSEPWGVWHRPFGKMTRRNACVETSYSTNSFGMRDTRHAEMRGRREIRVAVLGGSLSEGQWVGDEETYARVLEQEVFHTKIEVLNFGTSDPFGTTQAWQLYKHLTLKFHPNVVVLAFSHEKDLHANMWSYWKEERPAKHRPYLVAHQGAEFELFYPAREYVESHPIWAKVRDSLTRYSSIARIISATYGHREDVQAKPFPTRAIYSRMPHPDIEAAWVVTTEALKRFDREVKSAGGRLVVMQLVDPLQIDPVRAQKLIDEGDYDPMIPNRRLQQITHKLGIRYFSLLDDFQSYRDTEKLEAPYFSHSCVPHWSPLGHRVAAEALGRYLTRNRLLRQ
jgi:hypothetical protein